MIKVMGPRPIAVSPPPVAMFKAWGPGTVQGALARATHERTVTARLRNAFGPHMTWTEGDPA